MGAHVPGDMYLNVAKTTVVMHSGPELARDRIRSALRAGKGIYTYDRNLGFPWRGFFELRGSDIGLAQSIFVRWLSAFDFIESVDSVSAEHDSETRNYSITFSASSTYGRIEDTLNFGVS